MNEIYSEDIVIELPININNLKLTVICRVVENEDPFYDFLINLTQIDNHLFIHPILYSLCKFNNKGLVDVIAPINNEYNNEEKLLCIIKALDRHKSKKNLKKIEGLPPKKYIQNKQFYETLNPLFGDKIVNLLQEYFDIIATSIEELTPSDLSPHKIILKEGAKPIKQKFYRLTKLKSDILQEIIAKLVEQRLIEPSSSEWSSSIALVPKF
ncbi:hypothetical protein BCR32DRAFT_249635 [Anaeromyces robustus]|uniref:Uncharacterized protein n=1 Tax=Anaeromyces robustus TaxID=1754192 RepID=A0A1Y1WPZ6_9FUNG|nr:hypothetical protein BCR32DRAFT_249635 [Anaeromyces robustus]|eukprot:ORX75336.1 hypothetical protein BCR32DRAFT_249635 [Anaeromyces robustus]